MEKKRKKILLALALGAEWMAWSSIAYKVERNQQRGKMDSRSVWICNPAANDMSYTGCWLLQQSSAAQP